MLHTLLAWGLSVTPAVADEPLPLLDHAALEAELQRLAGAHASATLVTLGESRGGRGIHALELAGELPPAAPAILVVANLDGPDVFDSAVALDHARRLAEGYGSDEAVTALLDRARVIVLPRANPDAAEAWFVSPRHELRTGGRDVDNDRDGRVGEDGPADVNGDGLVTWMRVPDPDGTWIPDPTDERAQVEADGKKGEVGRWKLVREGRDADGDGEVAEDPASDTVLNRNFASGWEEHASDAGLFPTAEPEVRALMELVLSRPELALVLCYGSPDNLVGKPKTVADDARPRMRVPQEGVLQSDADLVEEIGSRYRELTGNAAEGDGADAGTFQRWCYDHRGLWVLGTELWEMPEQAVEPPPAEAGDDEADAGDAAAAPAEDAAADSAEPNEGAGDAEGAPEGPADAPEADPGEKEDEAKPSRDAKRLQWIDSLEDEAWRFVAWEAFEHPDLGPVEIGGFAPYAHAVPPASDQAELASKHLDFLLTLGELLPRPRIAECTAEDLGGGLWRVEVALQNDALLPLLSRSARRTRTTRPARLRIEVGDGEILGGRVQVLVSELGGAGGRHEEHWLVRTDDPASLTVTLDTDHAGETSATPEVQR